MTWQEKNHFTVTNLFLFSQNPHLLKEMEHTFLVTIFELHIVDYLSIHHVGSVQTGNFLDGQTKLAFPLIYILTSNSEWYIL